MKIGRPHFKIGRDVLKLFLLGLLLIVTNYLGTFSEIYPFLLCTIPETIVLFIRKVM